MKKQTEEIFLQNRKLAMVFLCVVFLAPTLFCLAQTTTSTNSNAVQPMYYLIPIVWDAKNNTIGLKQGVSVSLTKENLTKDTGSGSQFYARVINFNNQSEIFPNGQAKIFLGNWQAEKNSDNTGIDVTVPAYKDGRVVVIYDAITKKVVFTSNVSKFSRLKVAKTQSQSKVSVPANLQTSQIKSQPSAIWWLTGIIVLLLIIGAVSYLIYRWRKKKKVSQDLGTTNPPRI